MKKKKIEFYSGYKILSYGTAWIFLIGNRNGGKSFFWKEYAVKRFIKAGEQFIYIRRYKNDLKRTAKNFFNDIAFKFKGHKLQYRNGEYWIDGKLAGLTMALTEVEKNKSNSLPEVKLLIFDEFLNSQGKYIGGRSGQEEVEACLNVYQTIARGNGEFIMDDVKMVFISNAMSIINPYFLYFGIDRRIQPNTKFLRQENGKKGWALELYVNPDARDAVKESKFGDLIEGTEYGAMALDNEFFLDKKEFIEEPPKGVRYQCTMIYAGKKFGLWADRLTNMFYCTEKVDPSCKIVYSLDTDSHTSKSVLTNRSSAFFKAMDASYKNGQMRFSNQLAKNAVLIYLKL